ncbi:F-actin-uncapping protein LRRC16A isoform X3 [Ictalurus punctatus]|uniref:F-actin-uncapping protein LRRC16A isoform X3 n=1 Tax=Ictalurus punctatus TaxID=7998 RepID=A0A9F7RJ13_ICTPU|nr:F-actin-uncapping protein LRRC16A isoform X3 [Ictalurus punctatus]
MVSEEDFSKEVLESVQDAVGRQLKLSLRKKVQLEGKGDKQDIRILALAPHRAFLLSARVPARIEQSFNFFDIQAVGSSRPGQLVVDYDKGQLCVKLSSNEEVDEVIAQMGVSIQEHCPGLNPLRVMKKLSLKPAERTTSLQAFWENNPPPDTGPCGAFSRMYWCVCDQMGLPYRAEVQWDVDTIYLTQDTKELNLQDFIHLETRDLMAIVAVLEYNQWFTKISLKDYKLSTDLCDQILRVVARSSRLEELALENTGLKADFAQKLASALSQNPHSALHTLNLANNSVEDKGIASLSSPLGKLSSGLKHVNLSKNSLSAKGVNILAQSLCSNSSFFNTLKHLDLSGNTLRGDDLANLWNFLSQPNSLHTLDLSSCDCALDLVCSSLLRGSLKHLSVLNMSKSVLSIKKGKELPSSFKQFFGSALALNTIVLSGTKLPPEALKALLLGLACNPNLKEVSLDLSSCELRSAGAQILEGCIAEMPNVSSLDISDNGLDSDLTTLLVWLAKNRSIRQLSLGKNFNNIKSKNLGQVLNNLVLMIQEEESPLSSLSLADSKLKADLSMVLNAVGGNSSLTRLDISGNGMGDMGAKMLAKALQINTKLRTVIWDRNNVSAQGLQDVAAALEKNYTIRFMPVPIMDAAQALKSSPEKTEDALMKMEQYLLRNHETRKYLQEQAYRLQQGIVTSTTQQMIDRLCVKVQDHLNSLRFSEREKVQEDMKAAERLVQDARNSKRLLASMYQLRSARRRGRDGGEDAEGGGGDGEGGGACEAVESPWVAPIQDKLQSMAGEVSTVINQQLQSLLVSMVDTAESVCPHVMHTANLRPSLMRVSEGKMSVPRTFITNTLLEQSAIDIINKISEVKLSVASFLSDRIIDEILESLSHSQRTLAEHLSRRGQPMIHHNSEESEVLEEEQLDPKNLPSPSSDILLSPTSKRQSILFRMVRPISVAFELEFDLDKALEHVPIHMEDPPVPPPHEPVEAGLERPGSVCFIDLPETESPKLQHMTKLRPRRKKTNTKPRKAASTATADVEQTEFVGKVDEGLDDFFAKKVTKIGTKRSTIKDAGQEGEKKRESRMSGFFNLIKSRTSLKSPPTSPHTPTPAPTITESDNVESTTPAVKSPIPEHTQEPIKTQVPEKVEPCEPVDTAMTSESKGHVEESKKKEAPPGGRIRGVQVMGNDFLAQLRAKQEKMKDKTSDSSSANKADSNHADGDSAAVEKPAQKEHHQEAVSKSPSHSTHLLKPTAPAPASAAKHTPPATHTGLKASLSPPSSNPKSTPSSHEEHHPSQEHLPHSSSTPANDASGHLGDVFSTKQSATAQHQKEESSKTETEEHICVSPGLPPIVLDPAAEGSVFEPESYTQPSHTAAAGQCCASLHSSSSTSAAEEKDDRQRTVSLPAQVDLLTPTDSTSSPEPADSSSTYTHLPSSAALQHTDPTQGDLSTGEDESVE